MRTGGQVLADALVAHGSELAFCVPGESYLGAARRALRAPRRVPHRQLPPRGRGGQRGRRLRQAHRPARAVLRHARAGRDARGDRHPHRAPGLDAADHARRPGRARRARARVVPGARLRGRVRLDGEVGVRARRPRAHPRGARARVHGGDQRAAGPGRAGAAGGRPGRGGRGRRRAALPRRCARRRRPRRSRSWARCSRRRSGRSCSSAAGRGTRAARRRSPAGRRAAGCRSARPSGARTSSTTCARATPATSGIGVNPKLAAADPRLRPAGGGRHAAGRDRDAGLHAARAAGRAAAARPRPPRPRRARPRLPAVAGGAQRRGGVRGRRAGGRRVALGRVDRRRAGRLRGVGRATRRRRATASTSAR